MTPDQAATLRRQALAEGIVDAVRKAVLHAIDAGTAIDTAVERAVARELGGDGEAQIERPAQRRARQNAEALQQMDQLERDGRGRSAARIVAKRIAIDPRDAVEVEAIAHRIRRMRRKKADSVRMSRQKRSRP